MTGVETWVYRVESHPVRNAESRVVTGYMVPVDEWRSIRSELRGNNDALVERVRVAEAKVARAEALAEVWDERNYPGMVGIASRVRAALASDAGGDE